jgi:hypothetical protein
MHRTGVLGVWIGGGRWSSAASRGVGERVWLSPEPFEAALVAEVLGSAAVIDPTDRVGREDRHSTDGIDYLLVRGLAFECHLHDYLTYFWGSASNRVLQAFAQK